jgi:phospholipid transport system substrate-binding protein
MKQLFLVLMLWGSTWPLYASANVPPDELVKQTTDKVLTELDSNREVLMSDRDRLYRLVDEIVLPHFDFSRMSQLVLGRYWRSANDVQKEQFTGEFKTLLVRTYATALFEYQGQKITYKPSRVKDGDDRAVVQTEIKPADGPAIPMHYALAKDDDGRWRVFDIRIDGISLVTNYRSSYGRTIQNDGIDALISSLSLKNQELMHKQ